MTEKLDIALARLHSILPLKKRQNRCTPKIKALHQQILRSYVENGRSLTKAEIVDQVSDPDEAIDVLQNNDMVVFDNNGEPVGAYPFTMEEREHKIQVNGHQVHAMCVLDALAISPMFGIDTEIHSVCRATGEPVHILQSGKHIQNSDEAGAVHFGIVWGAASSCASCADSLCTEMIFLRNNTTAQAWLADDRENREIFNLQDSVEFAAQFFGPLMT